MDPITGTIALWAAGHVATVLIGAVGGRVGKAWKESHQKAVRAEALKWMQDAANQQPAQAQPAPAPAPATQPAPAPQKPVSWKR